MSSPPQPPSVPPIRRSVSVAWDPETAFHRFTAQFGDWWPRLTLSIGGKLVKRIVFECHAGGRIIEELHDGRRFQWGKITGWDPPRRVAFTWHPSKDEHQAQDVEVTFEPEGSGTRVELVSTGWERLDARGRGERKGYDLGWRSVLEVFAGRSSMAMAVMGAVSGLMTLWLRVTGKLESSIEEAGGRLPPASADSSEEVMHEAK